jgi:hypothetical protein
MNTITAPTFQGLLAVADVAPSARGILVAIMVAGTLLIMFGAKLLRPAVVLAAMFVGFLGAVITARALLPGMPLWGAAAIGAVAGLLAGSLLYRPTVGVAASIVGATVGALVAFAIMAGGSLDTAPRDLNHALVINPREVGRPGEGNRAGMRLLEILNGADATATAQPSTDVIDGAAPAGERMLRTTVDVAHRASDRVDAAYEQTAPAYRTLLTGSIAAGAIIGLMAGLIATTIVARVLTSCAGAWLLLVGSLPLLAMHGYEPLPHDARSWLITIGSLALAGTIAQSYLGGSTGAKRAPRRAKPDPAPDAEPALAK